MVPPRERQRNRVALRRRGRRQVGGAPGYDVGMEIAERPVQVLTPESDVRFKTVCVFCVVY
jgi:hypothetical protein